ncbi:uncharacterized protein METZ01_LOCUS172663, partial [marine metagenome]
MTIEEHSVKVIPMFSVPLFQTNIGPPDAITKAWIVNLDYPQGRVGVTAGIGLVEEDPTKQGFHILNNPQLKSLKIKIQKAIDYFVHDILDITDDVTVSIETSWINQYKQGEHNMLHNHTNSILSGVYYIDFPPNSGNITFSKTNLYNNIFPMQLMPQSKGKKNNQYNLSGYEIVPETGNVLIFPSFLHHGVPPNPTKQDRYSLAFNTYIRGEIGHGPS